MKLCLAAGGPCVRDSWHTFDVEAYLAVLGKPKASFDSPKIEATHDDLVKAAGKLFIPSLTED